MSPENCPKWNKCSAPICPFDPDWLRRRHAPGEPICLWLREWSKDPSGRAQSIALGEEGASRVGEVAPRAMAASSDIWAKLEAASRQGSKFKNGRSLRGLLMSPSRRVRAMGRSESGSFLALPHQVLNSPNYLALSAHGCKLLVDVAAQYKGNNNGDLCAAWTLMQKRGWKSRDTLHKASDEIRYYGLLELTRQGGLNSPNLYALTWQPIDACNGKLDVPSTRVASGLWKKPKPPRPKPLKKRSKSEGQHAERVDRHGGRASEQQTE